MFPVSPYKYLPRHLLGDNMDGHWLRNNQSPTPKVPMSQNPIRRTSLRRWWPSHGLIIMTIATGALATAYVAFPTIVGTPTGSTLLSCGFEQGQYWDTVGSGVPQGTQYIQDQSTPPLSAYGVGPTNPIAIVTAYAYGAGSGTEEYLVGEISFFCTSIPSSGTTTVSVQVSDTTPLGATATYGVLFVQTGSSSNTDPTTTAACDGTSPNYLYEPSGGGTIWAWNAQTGGLLSSISGCPNSFNTGTISISVASASSTVPLITVSFGFVGMPTTNCYSSCSAYTTFTLSFQAANS